jgi:hypothetical protein
MPFKPAIPKLMPGRMKNAEADRQCLHVDVPAGTDLETVMEPLWWGNYARAARPKDIIEVFCDDGTWEARFRVLFVSNQEIRLVRPRMWRKRRASLSSGCPRPPSTR